MNLPRPHAESPYLHFAKFDSSAKFNLATNGSGISAIAAWENTLASPFAQDKTVVIGTSDGGTGIMTNAVVVYVGTKQTTGSDVDKAGLTNGTAKLINVAGNAFEIADDTTFAGDLEFDSLTVMDFVAAIEDEFDIIISMNQQAEIETYRDLVDAVCELTEG